MDGAETFAAQEAFRPYLMPGESILWTGRPRQGIMFQASDVFVIPFSIAWASGGIGIPLMAVTQGALPPFPFVLIMLIFPIVGVYVLFGRFLHDMWVRRHILYAVSNKRVMALRRAFGTKLIAQDIRSLGGAELTEGRNGRGTIVFNTNAMGYWGANRFAWSPAFRFGLQFLGVDDARAVYDLIQRTAATPAP